MAVSDLLYESVCWNLTTHQINGTETAKMRFLRAVEGYSLILKKAK
jgi:hypothetical protein